MQETSSKTAAVAKAVLRDVYRVSNILPERILVLEASVLGGIDKLAITIKYKDDLVHASTNKHACALDDIAVDSGVAASADQLVPACAEICPSPSSKRPPPF